MSAQNGVTNGAGGPHPAGAPPPEAAGAAAQAPVISEVEAGRLLRGLEQLEADYEQTVAAERRAAERSADAPAESDGERDGSEPHEAGAMDGYMALGSECDSGSEAHSDDEGEGAPAATQCAAASADALAGEGAASNTQEAAAGSGGAQQGAAVVLEDFADFSHENPALPLPPAELPQLAAMPLAQDDVELIKKTMQKVSLPPPKWAANISDEKLAKMVRDLSKEV